MAGLSKYTKDNKNNKCEARSKKQTNMVLVDTFMTQVRESTGGRVTEAGFGQVCFW
ncbi:hypothetical protein [Escherichia coli]|uniref:hypothetical protein n=1 Tax=Escherichia coli TaxID=562 RepID=UPI003F498F00